MTVRGGRYEVLRAIASGGMASVHLGRALGAGGFERLVAIKVMHAHLAEEPEFVAMFFDEARLAAKIRHPNVVGTIDIQEDEQGVFLVMEYVEGPSLQRVLRVLAKKKLGPLPQDIALRIFLDTLEGLHAAHELTDADGRPLLLVHRDVSPQNVLVGVDGVSKITDFGVARAESRLSTTRAGVVKGKVCYMAPEQIRSEPIDRRTDVYAAGALLWELCTGQRLIRGDNDGAMMDKILRSDHPDPRDLNPSVPEAVAAACRRALSAAPADRFQTAAEFAVALEEAGKGISIASTRAVSTLIKGIDVEPAGAAQPSSSQSGSLDRAEPIPRSRPEERAISGATPATAPGPTPLSTHSAVLSVPREHEKKPGRTSPLLLAGAGLALLLLGAGGVLLARPLLGGPAAPSQQAATETPTARATEASARPPEAAVDTPASAAPVPVASAPSAPAASASAKSAAPAAVPAATAPRKERQKPAPAQTTFRPKDL